MSSDQQGMWLAGGVSATMTPVVARGVTIPEGRVEVGTLVDSGRTD